MGWVLFAVLTIICLILFGIYLSNFNDDQDKVAYELNEAYEKVVEVKDLKSLYRVSRILIDMEYLPESTRNKVTHGKIIALIDHFEKDLLKEEKFDLPG